MIHINEWKIPDWVALEWDSVPPARGARPKRPPVSGAARPQDLADVICARLKALADGPSTVHFLEGEGLRWIRVGFDAGRTLRPADVGRIGREIASCVGTAAPLYFHALRPRDMLFFLEGGKSQKVGMDALCFGEPLAQVLLAWGRGNDTAPRSAPAQAAPRRRARSAHSKAPAPYSQRRRTKP